MIKFYCLILVLIIIPPSLSCFDRQGKTEECPITPRKYHELYGQLQALETSVDSMQQMLNELYKPEDFQTRQRLNILIKKQKSVVQDNIEKAAGKGKIDSMEYRVLNTYLNQIGKKL